MFILLTNDDGIDSEGLFRAKQALETVAQVAIIAPHRNWSLSGHARTIDRPLRTTRVTLADGSSALSTNGTPADAVSLGVLGLLERRPDLVVSGINKGPNLGYDILYSGTVAAAMEAAVVGIPAIAVSLADYVRWEFSLAADFIARLVATISQHSLPNGLLLNVNIPHVPREEIAGVEITRLGKRVYRDQVLQREDPLGRTYYWIGGEAPSGIMEEGTDYHAVMMNKISLTPLNLDCTDTGWIEELRRWDISL
ncbi:MAG: 5'/3'-nucleotidase SurE [Chloroflexi bacterium]|nr:5'/3'-nucleotidase SurE [Chloroflexota bacterium]